MMKREWATLLVTVSIVCVCEWVCVCVNVCVCVCVTLKTQMWLDQLDGLKKETHHVIAVARAWSLEGVLTPYGRDLCQ